MRFGIGGGSEAKAQRMSLPKDIATALAQQFSSLHGQDLSGFTYEQRKSSQAGAKHDLAIYDADGVLRYEGRSFGGSQSASFWKHNGG